MVDNEILIMAAFLGSGLLAYVIVPGLLVMWDRVLGHRRPEKVAGRRNDPPAILL